MNFFMEKSGNDISEDDAHYYSEEDAKTTWMRETRIRTFMQLDLESCLDDINRMTRCHNCEALNCPQEEYRTRPLPIAPDYIDNLQNRLIKVRNGTLPPTLKRSSRRISIFQHAQRSQPHQQCSSMISWGDIGTNRTAHRSDHEPRTKTKRWLQTAPRAQMRGEILFPKPRSRRTTRQQNSPIAISNWR